MDDTVILLLRILLAAALGGALGLERDMRGRAAGLRTHLLVGTGSALFMVISTHIGTFGPELLPGVSRVTDPGRIAAQIVTGIGFLGAGAIIKEGFTIRGLTTAASLWVAAAIGMACGGGFYLLALWTSALALISLVGLPRIEKRFRRGIYRELILVSALNVDPSIIVESVSISGVRVLGIDLTENYEEETSVIKLSLRMSRGKSVEAMPKEILARVRESGVPLHKVKWRQV